MSLTQANFFMFIRFITDEIITTKQTNLTSLRTRFQVIFIISIRYNLRAAICFKSTIYSNFLQKYLCVDVRFQLSFDWCSRFIFIHIECLTLLAFQAGLFLVLVTAPKFEAGITIKCRTSWTSNWRNCSVIADETLKWLNPFTVFINVLKWNSSNQNLIASMFVVEFFVFIVIFWRRIRWCVSKWANRIVLLDVCWVFIWNGLFFDDILLIKLLYSRELFIH